MIARVLTFRRVIIASIATALVVMNMTTVGAAPNYSRTNSPYVEGTDAAAGMFDPLSISDVKLTATQEVYDYFRSCCNWAEEGPWMHGQLTMTVKGVTVGPLEIGWHLKGAWGSWVNIDSKPGIKIRVDAFVDGQTIFGVKKLILNNMWQEGSAMNQQLTMKLFRAMKVPASRTGYSHLTINNIDYGLYTNIESLDRVSLARWYPTTKHLYKGGVPYHDRDLVTSDEWALQVETGSKTNRSDLTPFLAANSLPYEQDAQWWTEIQKYADMKEMTREWAVEYAIGHWDGYANNGNNYFIHADNSGIFTMLPWGVDNTQNGPIDYHYPNKIMAQRCIRYSPCAALFNQAVADAAYAIRSLNLQAMANSIAAVINPQLQVEPAGRRNWGYWDTYYQQQGILNNMNYSADWPLQNYITNGLSEAQWSDSALARVSVNNTTFTPGPMQTDLGNVTLTAGARSVTTSAFARQNTSRIAITGKTNLVAGWNLLTIKVTSPNSLTTRDYVVHLYVPTNKTKTMTVNFTSTGALTASSNADLATAANDIKGFQVTSLTLSSAGTTATRGARLAKVVDALARNGISGIASKSHVSNPKMAAGSASITIKYVG
ncbi:MAG: hypothetical protein RL410_1007 [Actinomycetota bacterium]|jgi:hypothetical protein